MKNKYEYELVIKEYNIFLGVKDKFSRGIMEFPFTCEIFPLLDQLQIPLEYFWGMFITNISLEELNIIYNFLNEGKYEIDKRNPFFECPDYLLNFDLYYSDWVNFRRDKVVIKINPEKTEIYYKGLKFTAVNDGWIYYDTIHKKFFNGEEIKEEKVIEVDFKEFHKKLEF